MSYEEFLDLPVTRIQEIAKIIRYKREHNIPYSDEEEELVEHFVRYTQELKLQENKARLEHFYNLKSYEK
jgi:hypothetical protein